MPYASIGGYTVFFIWVKDFASGMLGCVFFTVLVPHPNGRPPFQE